MGNNGATTFSIVRSAITSVVSGVAQGATQAATGAAEAAADSEVGKKGLTGLLTQATKGKTASALASQTNKSIAGLYSNPAAFATQGATTGAAMGGALGGMPGAGLGAALGAGVGGLGDIAKKVQEGWKGKGADGCGPGGCNRPPGGTNTGNPRINSNESLKNIQGVETNKPTKIEEIKDDKLPTNPAGVYIISGKDDKGNFWCDPCGKLEKTLGNNDITQGGKVPIYGISVPDPNEMSQDKQKLLTSLQHNGTYPFAVALNSQGEVLGTAGNDVGSVAKLAIGVLENESQKAPVLKPKETE